MTSENESRDNGFAHLLLRGVWHEKMRRVPLVGYFWEKSFFHYLWTGGLFTVLNIFGVWFFIEILKIQTVISSAVVIGGLFVLRYVVYRVFKVMG